MSKTALQTLKASLRFAYYEALSTRKPEMVLEQVKYEVEELKALEREQIIKAYVAGQRLKGACTPEAYYRLVYEQGEDV